MNGPYFHQLLIPADLASLQWRRVKVGEEQYLQKTFETQTQKGLEDLITAVDEIEFSLSHLATVVANQENYAVTIRLTTAKYGVPTILDINFARRVEATYLNSLKKGEERPFLFIDFDGTVRCIVLTPDDESGRKARAPIECDEVEVFPQVTEILQRAKDEGYTIIGVTNQSSITRRGIPKEKIEACIEETKRQIGLEFPVYFSQDKGALYKPNIGMGIEAINDYGPIDFSQSLMVGDNHRGGDWGFAEGMGINFAWAQEYFEMTPEQIECSLSPAEALRISPTNPADSILLAEDFSAPRGVPQEFSERPDEWKYISFHDYTKEEEEERVRAVEGGWNYILAQDYAWKEKWDVEIQAIGEKNYTWWDHEIYTPDIGWDDTHDNGWDNPKDWMMTITYPEEVDADGSWGHRVEAWMPPQMYYTAPSGTVYDGFGEEILHLERQQEFAVRVSFEKEEWKPISVRLKPIYRGAKMKKMGVLNVWSAENRARRAEANPPLKGKTTEAPYEVKVYVPSTRLDEEISKEEYRNRIKQTQSFLADLFGGYTSLGAKGGYVSDVEGLICEPVVLVTCWAGRQAYEDKLPELEEFLIAKREEWGQEVIGFEFENDFFMFPEYQDSAADFFLTETNEESTWYEEAEKGIKNWINSMLTLRNQSLEVDGKVVFKGWGSPEDHAIAADYENWLFENCERFDVEKGEYFTCTMHHKAEMKQCYYNSLMYTWEDREAQYYEGWVVSERLSMPIRHAWIVKEGQVFDPTFEVLREEFGRKGEERICYYGVEIPSEFILHYISAFEVSGPFLFDYYFSLKEEYAPRRDGLTMTPTIDNRNLKVITDSFMGEKRDIQE